MKGLQLYVKEAYNELTHKVTWPTWEELQESALIVLVAALIFAVLVLGMDFLSKKLMEVIYSIVQPK